MRHDRWKGTVQLSFPSKSMTYTLSWPTLVICVVYGQHFLKTISNNPKTPKQNKPISLSLVTLLPAVFQRELL